MLCASFMHYLGHTDIALILGIRCAHGVHLIPAINLQKFSTHAESLVLPQPYERIARQGTHSAGKLSSTF